MLYGQDFLTQNSNLGLFAFFRDTQIDSEMTCAHVPLLLWLKPDVVLLNSHTSFGDLQIVPLVAITFIFWLSCKPVFQKPMNVVALRTAVDLDREDK